MFLTTEVIILFLKECRFNDHIWLTPSRQQLPSVSRTLLVPPHVVPPKSPSLNASPKPNTHSPLPKNSSQLQQHNQSDSPSLPVIVAAKPSPVKTPNQRIPIKIYSQCLCSDIEYKTLSVNHQVGYLLQMPNKILADLLSCTLHIQSSVQNPHIC